MERSRRSAFLCAGRKSVSGRGSSVDGGEDREVEEVEVDVEVELVVLVLRKEKSMIWESKRSVKRASP